MHKRDGDIRLDIGDVFKLPSGRTRYVVETAVMDGGGTGHGPHDIYPDGWHIRARALGAGDTYNPKGKLIDFYQSGCFSGMKTNIMPLGQLTRTVTITFSDYKPYPQETKP